MKQGRADKNNTDGRKWDIPSANAMSPSAVDMLGQSTSFKRPSLHQGRGFEAPKGKPQRVGVGGGRTLYRSGSQGRR